MGFIGANRLFTLSEAAQLLGLSYERVRVLVAGGRLRASHSAMGRVVSRAELERFGQFPRIPGRPTRVHPARRLVHHATPPTVQDLLDRVERRTGMRFTHSYHRHMVRLGFLPHRGEFPQGERGKRACLAQHYRRLVRLAHLQQRHVRSYRDQVIAMRYFGYRLSHEATNRAMISYLYQIWQGHDLMTMDDIEDFALNESIKESPPSLPTRLSPKERREAYTALVRIASGQEFTPQEMTVAREALGLPDGLLPMVEATRAEPGLTWGDLFTQIQASGEKIIELTRASIIGVVQRGNRRIFHIRLLGPPEELDKVWTFARPILFRVLPRLVTLLRGANPRVHIFMVNATIIKVVTHCLLLLREYGEDVFTPFKGELAWFNSALRDAAMMAVMAPPPQELAPLVGRLLTNPVVSRGERLLMIKTLEGTLKQANLADSERQVVQELLAVVRHPSKKNLRKMAALYANYTGYRAI